MTSVLSISGLTKSFNGLKAVDSLSLQMESGEVYGFLGPNGAGKTTTIKSVLGLIRPDGGRVTIEGLDVTQNPHEIKRRIGFMPERVAFYDNLTALQNLEFFARLKGSHGEDLMGLLESVGLEKFARKKVVTFSKGMVQLLGFAQALIGAPRLLILDEPTIGLDPRWTRVVKDRIKTANDLGTSVFFSSHILTEVQELADRVGILNKGVLLAQDTVENLSDQLELKPRLRLNLDGDPATAMRTLRGLEGVGDMKQEGGELIVECSQGAKTRVLARLEAAKIGVRDFRTEEPSLEEVFLRYTGGKEK